MSYIENARKLRPIVEQAMQSIDGNDALTAMSLYPEWASNTAYIAGYKLTYDGKLWRVLQAHTSQIGWEPSTATASLFQQIEEIHIGTIDDPIPYNGNMALESGLYYVQEKQIYLCTRDTIVAVYNPLSELVGIYVELV